MPGDFIVAESRSRPLLLGLAIALGAVAASALLSRFRARMAVRPLDSDAPYLGWVAHVLNEDRRARNDTKPTLH